MTDALGQIGARPAGQVSITDVGPTWGSQITEKAIMAVLVFFIVVVVYISFRFEWKMAIAALIAVIHDLLVTAGIYSLSGFQVTPDTVIAVLTILGYSLYDTVVVFDRVGENTKGLGASGRMTYEDIVNLSMNQTLARSINTSLVAILPVLSVLVIGAQILGATTLQYFGLALVIGLTSGAYSSIFIASPVLAVHERARAALRQHPAQARQPGRPAPGCSPRAAAALAVPAGRHRARARPAPAARARPPRRAGRPACCGPARPPAATCPRRRRRPTTPTARRRRAPSVAANGAGAPGSGTAAVRAAAARRVRPAGRRRARARARATGRAGSRR